MSNKNNLPENMKHYKMVHERVVEFRNDYPNSSIDVEVSIDKEWVSGITEKPCHMYMCKVIIIPDVQNPDSFFVGHANETDDQGFVNRKNALENCETSALGRALSWVGYVGQEASITTDDVLDKAKNFNLPKATNKQIEHLNSLVKRCKEKGLISITQSKTIDQNKKDMDLKGYSDHVMHLDQLLVDDKLAQVKKDKSSKKKADKEVSSV